MRSYGQRLSRMSFCMRIFLLLLDTKGSGAVDEGARERTHLEWYFFYLRFVPFSNNICSGAVSTAERVRRPIYNLVVCKSIFFFL